MDRTDLIKVVVEDHLRDAFSDSSFTSEVMEKVDRIIKSRIEHYKEYFKDNPQAREFAEKFTPQEIARLGTHEKHYKPSKKGGFTPKEHYYLVHSYLREREYIIKYFYEPGLTYEQMRTRYVEDRFNNPRKYNLTDTHKKRILKDWAKHFPEMVPFKSKYSYYHTLSKMVGPFIFTIGIGRSNLHKDKYKTLLWVEHLLLPMNKPSISILESESKGHWDITVIDHHQGFYTDIIEIVREKFWFPLEGDVSLEQIFSFIKDNDAEVVALALSWAGRKDLAVEFRDKELNVLKNLKEKNPSYYKENATKQMQLFNFEYDPDNVGGAWEQKFIDIIDDPDFIRDIVRTNVKKYGVELGLNIFPYQDIKDAPYKELALR
jgi:hypothetical protein